MRKRVRQQRQLLSSSSSKQPLLGKCYISIIYAYLKKRQRKNDNRTSSRKNKKQFCFGLNNVISYLKSDLEEREATRVMARKIKFQSTLRLVAAELFSWNPPFFLYESVFQAKQMFVTAILCCVCFIPLGCGSIFSQ